MNTALKFSLRNKLIKNEDVKSILNHLEKAKLPINIKKFFSLKDLNKILSFMTKDKKNNSDKINLVLLKKIGQPIYKNQYSKNDLATFLRQELIN